MNRPVIPERNVVRVDTLNVINEIIQTYH